MVKTPSVIYCGDTKSSGFEENPKNCFYIFNKTTGVLQLSTKPSDLEKLLAQVGKLPEQGATVELSKPPLNKAPVKIRGVREIKSISGLTDTEYVWTPDYIKIL